MLSIAEISAREQIYQFLASSLLKEPSKELMDGLQEMLPLLKESFSSAISFDEWEDILQLYQKGIKTLQDLQQDFYDLFFVPNSGRYSPAVESIVLQHKMWTEIELEVAQRYEKVHFDPENLQVFIPFKQLKMADLLGFELAYMAHLCHIETYSSMETREKLHQEELNMLEKHLIPFVEKYKEHAATFMEGTLYRGLIDLILHFSETDRQLILNSGVIQYAE